MHEGEAGSATTAFGRHGRPQITLHNERGIVHAALHVLHTPVARQNLPPRTLNSRKQALRMPSGRPWVLLERTSGMTCSAGASGTSLVICVAVPSRLFVVVSSKADAADPPTKHATGAHGRKRAPRMPAAAPGCCLKAPLVVQAHQAPPWSSAWPCSQPPFSGRQSTKEEMTMRLIRP